MIRYLPIIVRFLVGAIFFVFGLNGFFNFIPMPATPPQKVVPFMTGLMAAGYFFPLLKLTEPVCELLLLSNRFVPLALIVLAPIVVNIAAVHFVLDPSGAPMAAFLVVALAYLGWEYRSYFRGVLTAKTEPSHSSAYKGSNRVPAAAT